MNTRTHSRAPSGARPAHSHAPYKSSSFSKPRFGGKRPNNNRSGGGKGRRGPSERIDFSRFIKKAELVAEAPYVATHTFGDFPFTEKLHVNILKKGFIHPMPIQDQAIKSILAGRDIFGLANTGTGKTAAFILPLIDKVARHKNEGVLILAPTRELAMQIDAELKELVVGMGIYSVACVGGLPIGKQVAEIRRGVSFVIGTPGRVRDLIERKVLNFSTCKSVVLDEADRMLDMGFRNEMVYILGTCAKERQTLFFSATLSPEIKKLTSEFLKDPTFISVVKGDTSKNVEQDVIRVRSNDEKIKVLHDVLIKDGSEKVLIFREMKHTVDALEKELKARGFKVGAIHGDKRSRDRLRTLDLFKKNEISILIATDVAARGLDIPNVTHVINYDIPSTYDTYVHRIGRTGRADKKGIALTFVPA